MLGSVCLSLGLPHSLTTPIGLVDSINHYGLVVTYSSGLYLSLLHSTLAQPIALLIPWLYWILPYSVWLYPTLHHSIPWFYCTLLGSTLPRLYLAHFLLYSWLYPTLPWTLLDSTLHLVLMYSVWLYTALYPWALLGQGHQNVSGCSSMAAHIEDTSVRSSTGGCV